MDAIRFRVEGIFNSFRVPFFRTYHKSFLAPPKTTVIGMLVNIMRKPESLYYKLLNDNSIQVSVVIDDIKGRAKELWCYKTLSSKSDMRGRSIIRRDKLYTAKYTIYLIISDNPLYKDVISALKAPKSIPYLGLDDEIVKIHDVVQIKMGLSETVEPVKINSVFMDTGVEYSVHIEDDMDWVELPANNNVPLRYKVKSKSGDMREARKSSDEYKQVEFLNCSVKVKGIKVYEDGENRVVFY